MNSNDDFEMTQRLPTLPADPRLDDALNRERAARIEIVELLRQNLVQAQEIEQLRGRHAGAMLPYARRLAHTIDQQAVTEEALFEVCGALKDALSKVLAECGTRGVSLSCDNAAHEALDLSCEKLERILCAPGFYPPVSARNRPQRNGPSTAAPMSVQQGRSISGMPGRQRMRDRETREIRVPHLQVLRSENLSAS